MPDTRGSVRQRKTKQDKPVPGDQLPPRNARVEELNTSDEEGEAHAADSAEESKGKKKKNKYDDEDEDEYSPWVDILRVLSFVFFVSCGLSYLISGGESFFWGMRNPPYYLQRKWWEAQWRGPLYLTLDELALHDGRDPELPLYLALNGTIYDVSTNPRIYGPGGSYNAFAGTDAARAFVTGCFAEDRTADMRGVEDMFLPVDDPEADAKLGLTTEAEWAEQRARELEAARRRVHDSLAHWVSFFGSGKRYQTVGYIKRDDPDWLEKEPRRQLCPQAAKSRKKRKPAPKED